MTQLEQLLQDFARASTTEHDPTLATWLGRPSQAIKQDIIEHQDAVTALGYATMEHEVARRYFKSIESTYCIEDTKPRVPGITRQMLDDAYLDYRKAKAAYKAALSDVLDTLP